jgi:uncharacterized UPF0146 family protein
MIHDYREIATYIRANYPGAKKIVEVGIGGENAVFQELKKTPGLEVVATDISPLEEASYDNVLEPNISLYKGSDLIYSVRPPPELIPQLGRIAKAVGANLLIRPLSTDSCHKPPSMSLVNFGKAVIWEKKLQRG